MEYSFHIPHKNADIVILGDSSALTGIDPRLLSSQLGLTAVNLPNTLPSLRVVGDMTLKHYLATNQPPRLIVFYLSSWDLNYSHEDAGTFLYDGEKMLAIHGGPHQIAAFAGRYPAMFIRFPIYFYAADITVILRNLIHRRHTADPAADADYISPAVYPYPLQPDCKMQDVEKKVAAEDNTALELLSHYRTAQTNVLLYLSPLPACARVAEVANRTFQGLSPDKPAILPAPFFSNDTTYDHPLPPYVPQTTSLLATAIRQKLQLPSTP